MSLKEIYLQSEYETHIKAPILRARIFTISGCLMIFVSLIFSPSKKHLYFHMGTAVLNFTVFVLISILSGAIDKSDVINDFVKDFSSGIKV